MAMQRVSSQERHGEGEESHHRSTAERRAEGKALRDTVSRQSHGHWKRPKSRPDPIDFLEASNEGRIPQLIPIRYGRMLQSPFAFYRGSAAIMASDLSHTPVTGLRVQVCGDCHLMNFGIFATPERRLIFDINDFDETLPGPWEWDVKRLATSFVIAGRDRGFASGDRRAIVMAGVREYREWMRQFAGMRNLDVWYAHIEIGRLLDRLRGEATAKQVKVSEQAVAKARTRDSMQAFSKMTREVDGERRIIGDPPLI